MGILSDEPSKPHDSARNSLAPQLPHRSRVTQTPFAYHRGMSTPLLNRQARQALQQHCRTDSELEQLILDHFAEERRLIPKGVDRLSIENRLIEVVGARAILRAIKGPRYYVAWLLQGLGVVGLLVGGALAFKQLGLSATGPVLPDLRPTSSHTELQSVGPVGPPAGAEAPKPAPSPTAPVPTPAPTPPGLVEDKGLIHQPPGPRPESRTTPSGGARIQCPAPGVLLERAAAGPNYQTGKLPIPNGYARAGRLKLQSVGGADQGRVLTTATIVEAEGARMEVHPDRTLTEPKVCAVPLGEALNVGRDLGKLVEAGRINLGSGDGVKVGALYEVLGDAVGDEDASGRSLGRRKIGTVRVTAVDSVFSEVERVDGEVSKGRFVRAKRSDSAGSQP